MSFRVIVCGSRDWHDRERIAERLSELPSQSVIVHGAARGADQIAAEEAEKLGLRVEAHPADWKKYGKRAGPIRNQEMAWLGGDLCIAFWDGRSTGTADMIRRATKAEMPTDIIRQKPCKRP